MRPALAAPKSRHCAALLALTAALYVAFMGTLPLFEPDEARYAEIPREMLESGDFVTPTLDCVRYLDKPPLHYWLTAGAFAVLGRRELAARVAPAAGALLTALGVWLVGRKAVGGRAGAASSLALTGSLMWVVAARVNSTDMTATALISWSLLSFMAAEHEGGRWPRRAWLAGFYGFAALATLTKGLIGLVFPAGVVFWYAVLRRRPRTFLDCEPWWGVALYLAVVAPWFALAASRNPGFLHHFFVVHHVRRFVALGGQAMHPEPAWYFGPVVLAGLLPFTGYLVPALRSLWREFRTEGLAVKRSTLREAPHDVRATSARMRRIDGSGKKEAIVRLAGDSSRTPLLAALWAGVVLAFFTLSRGKLALYVLPAFPPLALLLGRHLARADEDATDALAVLRRHWPGLAGAAVLVAALTALALGVRAPGVSAAWVIVPAALSLGTAAASLLAPRIGLPASAPIALAAPVLVASLVPWAARGWAPARTAKALAEVVAREAAPGEPVVVHGRYIQGIAFYARRRVVIVEAPKELAYGASLAPDRDDWFWTPERLLVEWRGARRLWLVTGEADLARPAPVPAGRATWRETLAGAEVRARAGPLVLLTNGGASRTREGPGGPR